MSGTREENVFMARIAESASRFEDMVEYIKRVARMGEELTIEERNLLSVAFKNSVGARRKAWRMVYADEKDPVHSESVAAEIRNYRGKIEAELRQKCEDILGVIDKELLPRATTVEAQVFYMKMKGDYHRYMAEFIYDDSSQELARQAYEKASEVATAGRLEPTNVTRLGLALNHSVFYFEVLGKAQVACQLAREAWDAAKAGLNGIDPEDRIESEQIMQLLWDNLGLWQADMAEANGARPPELDGTRCEDF